VILVLNSPSSALFPRANFGEETIARRAKRAKSCFLWISISTGEKTEISQRFQLGKEEQHGKKGRLTRKNMEKWRKHVDSLGKTEINQLISAISQKHFDFAMKKEWLTSALCIFVY